MLSKLRNTREFKTRLKLLFYSLDNERYPIFTDTLIFLNFIVKKKNFHLHPKKIRGRNCLLAFETRGSPLINQIIWISNRDKSEIGQVSFFRLTHFFFRRMHAIFSRQRVYFFWSYCEITFLGVTSIVLRRVISCILMTPNSGVTRSQKTRQRSFPFCFLSPLLNVFSFVVLSLFPRS